MSERNGPGTASGIALPQSAVDLINGPALGHVVSLNPDGSPHVTGVWLGMDGNDVVFASMYAWRKTKNLMRDQRVAISVEGAGFHDSGLREYLVLRGRAEVTEGGAFALLRRLAETYMGPGVAFPPDELADRAGYVMRMRVEEIGGVGPWTGAPPGLPEGHPGAA
ncbi:TIGR03618 family F420-dependent PPOX class oxidoreductase [Streptomyces hoynatensis]|uniref:TIGR03618 family F420-dependent PPOX class oxidoreductase n=1 Tax=Streptomyces hoynatensis TaxID=1141874 RepID=A0A3A9YI46_9ACTN|nr:TIGR03618 family F420-dependent PPOX class oxidoreductase [Streptomyces hoynatensis]RKN36700.1 TIGR03618 family F420-dependent PPOX class oxidoreductase [Streptomyces hoynatensis]